MIANRYEIVGPVISGGMSEVFQCNDIILQRQVAIKIVPSAEQKRIIDELNALFKMRSKHVVQVYDVITLDDGKLAIVMEFVFGRDLTHNTAVPETAIDYLKIIWQIASGISDIHSVDVIHRDIKPNNMKIDSEGVIKIFDFGLARDEGPSASTMGFVGTRGFAAPELYAQHATFSAAVDTYAFGVTALYMGLGDLPDEVIAQPPKPIGCNYFSFLSFRLAPDIANILFSCLDSDPAKRPFMKDVRDVLAKHLLFDKHKALIVFQGDASYLDADRRSVNLRLPSIGEVEINYNGFSFVVTNVIGDVFVNNARAIVGTELPGASVVALGAAHLQNQRKYITFDLSHPEIVL